MAGILQCCHNLHTQHEVLCTWTQHCIPSIQNGIVNNLKSTFHIFMRMYIQHVCTSILYIRQVCYDAYTYVYESMMVDVTCDIKDVSSMARCSVPVYVQCSNTWFAMACQRPANALHICCCFKLYIVVFLFIKTHTMIFPINNISWMLVYMGAAKISERTCTLLTHDSQCHAKVHETSYTFAVVSTCVYCFAFHQDVDTITRRTRR